MSVWPMGLRTPQSPARRPSATGPGVTGTVRSRRSGRGHLRGATSPSGWHHLGPSMLGTAGHSPGVLEHRYHGCATPRLSQWAVRGQTQREAGKGWWSRDQGSPGHRAGHRLGRAQRALPAPGPSPAFSAGGLEGSRAEGVTGPGADTPCHAPEVHAEAPWSALFAAAPHDRRGCPLAPRTWARLHSL